MRLTVAPKRSFLRGLLTLTAAAAAFSTASAGGCFDATSPFDPSDWSHCQKIPSDAHELYIYYTSLDDALLIGFHALQDTEGWTALGINGNGGMKGATFIVVRQEDDGTWIAEDRYAEDYAMPNLDEQQDVKLLFAEQENGQTAWGVAIPQNSCDADGNDYEILDRLTSMLWAVGSGHDFGYHAQRGQFQANLMQAPEEPANTDGLQYVELRMPNVTVVLDDGADVDMDPTNPYICSYFDLHEIAASEGFSTNDTLHVTRFSPVLNSETKHYVHHMILYACQSGEERGWEHLEVLPECTSMPEDCTEMKWPWAVGGGDFVFPTDVGLPVGGASNRFLILQMHYYNPSLDEGVIDNSGVKVYYTSEKKDQEAGVLQLVGAVNNWQRPGPLPAGKERVSLSFATPSECTQSVWSQPLNILGVGHHMHIYGVHQEINVVRNGVNLGAMRPESHYDFKHQSMDESVPKIRQLMPGDQITQMCDYDTTNAPGDVEFGDYTHQEMCYTAIYYYPRQLADSFGATPPWFDTTICSQPATSEEFQAANLSLCAESMYNNVPEFYFFADEVEQTFDLLTACNGGDLFQDLFIELPYLCPECQLTASCTAEEVLMHASGTCAYMCNDFGLSLYPDLNRTEPYEYGNWGCDSFSMPSIPEAPACQAKGLSTIDTIEVSNIVLKDIPEGNDEDGTSSADTNIGETDSTETESESTVGNPPTEDTSETTTSTTTPEGGSNNAASGFKIFEGACSMGISALLALSFFVFG